MKVSIKYRESLEISLECDLECQSALSVFFREKIIFDFFLQKGNIIFATFLHIYRKYYVSTYLLRKIIFHFPTKEKISYFPENYHLSRYTRKIIFQRYFFGKTMFSEHLKKISYFHVFF